MLALSKKLKNIEYTILCDLSYNIGVQDVPSKGENHHEKIRYSTNQMAICNS